MAQNTGRPKEQKYVEDPLMAQLAAIGWDVLCLDDTEKHDPEKSFRTSLADVIIERELKAALLRINPWLNDTQVDDLVLQIRTYPTNKLLENNIEILERITQGLSCDEEETGETNKPIHIIDYSNVDAFNIETTKNHFLAISQYKVRIPGTETHIIPDIVLFVNGLPLVVIECKAPDIEDPVLEGIEQLMRYQDERGSRVPEGVPELFYYNQFMVSTCYHCAKYSTITGKQSHFIEWKDPYPFKLSDIKESGTVSSQELLVAGMLEPSHLLDIVQNYTVFIEDDEYRTIKIAPRYMQYRGARKIIERLRSGNAAEEKGGTIWHTQGSGKSLTMMFVIRKMYNSADLHDYKIVLLIDRKDLQTQIFKTSSAIRYACNVAGSIEGLKKQIRNSASDVSIAMVHKFGEHSENEAQEDKKKRKTKDHKKRVAESTFPILNTSPKILVMIDEAHRSEYSELAANMWRSMPNSVKVAFTGTPIDKTTETFGGYIDAYTMRQAVKDEIIVEIKYEGRATESSISDADAMNRRFMDIFSYLEGEEQQKIMGRYTAKGYLEHKDVIRAKASDMLDHYIGTVFPNGFKAQVVAVSREAAYRYKTVLEELLPQKIAVLKKDNPQCVDIGQLEKLNVACVISASGNDEPYFKELADETTNNNIISGFKVGFREESKKGYDSSYGILVVTSMLLTGFDAPIEQVMYLDKVIRDHTLLQAIARVNRTCGADKKCGYVVDYVGVTGYLKTALSAYADADIAETISVLKNNSQDIDSLNSAYHYIIQFIDDKLKVATLGETEQIIEELVADERLREEFNAKFRVFSKFFDRVLPNPTALEYSTAYKRLSFIRQSVANRCRDPRFSMRDASKKVRAIIEEFLNVNGVNLRIEPISILDSDFVGKLKGKSTRAKCDELTYGILEYINVNTPKDPEFYERMSEKLEKILQLFKDNWDALYEELQILRREDIVEGREREETYGYNPITEMPFFALLKAEIFGTKGYSEFSEQEFDILKDLANDVLARLRIDSGTINFWNNVSMQNQLRTHIINQLLRTFPSVFGKRKEIAQKIMELGFQHYGKESR